MRVVRKIVIACISSVIFSFVLAIVGASSLDGSETDSFFSVFAGFFVAYLVFSAPVYLIGGVPFSFVADLILKRLKAGSWGRYAAALGIYILGGLLMMYLFLSWFLNGSLVEQEDDTATFFLWIGVAAALVFVHVEIYWTKWRKR